MSRPRCALAVLPAKDGDRDHLIRSLHNAKAVGLGDLGDVVPVASSNGGSARTVLAEGAAAALSEGCDWLLAVSAAEALASDVFVKTAPALRVYDAVWGGTAVASSGNPAPKVERVTRLAAQDLPTFFHAALRWWIGPSHFVRPAAALRALQSPDTSAWYADYMLSLWKTARAYKTAQCLTLFHGDLPPVGEADRARLVEDLEREPVFMPIHMAAGTLRLPYTGLNPVIEREQMRGLFFEEEELRFLACRLRRGLRIVDVGANTGNHTLFFATSMEAATVIPIEPLPRAIAAIRAMVEANGLSNVDLSCLGCAVGATSGWLRPVPSLTAGLGATHFASDPQGTVPRVPLDDLVSRPVGFLKIDVEGMEMEALAGAASLIAANRPDIYVEVLDETIGQFMAWVDANSYRVEKLFPDKTHCNYLLVNAGDKKKVPG